MERLAEAALLSNLRAGMSARCLPIGESLRQERFWDEPPSGRDSRRELARVLVAVWHTFASGLRNVCRANVA